VNDCTLNLSRGDHAIACGWSFDMDYAKPSNVVAGMIAAGVRKTALGPRDLLVRGALSGALLGAATTLAFTGAVTTGEPPVGAPIFPVSLADGWLWNQIPVTLGNLVGGFAFTGACALRDLQAGQAACNCHVGCDSAGGMKAHCNHEA
jgi:formate/nitrite transporter FocA (FNT family)